MSSGDPTRVKSNCIPVYTTILLPIERCHGVWFLARVSNISELDDRKRVRQMTHRFPITYLVAYKSAISAIYQEI